MWVLIVWRTYTTVSVLFHLTTRSCDKRVPIVFWFYKQVMRGLSSIYIVCYLKKNANKKLKTKQNKNSRLTAVLQSKSVHFSFYEISEFWSAFLRGKINANSNIIWNSIFRGIISFTIHIKKNRFTLTLRNHFKVIKIPKLHI